MLRVDPSLFSNVVTAVQRTGNLPGGTVRGLPGGVSVEGLRGVDSFGSEIADAKKEFELGRVHASLQRVRQLEMQFGSIAGRWNATVSTIVSSARQGKQGLSLQKLQEVKNAQAKMRSLTSPATKTFRDLVTALEHYVAAGGHVSDEQEPVTTTQPDAGTEQAEREQAKPEQARASESEPARAKMPDPDLPDVALLGKFADKYRFGPRLAIEKHGESKRRIVPKLQEGRFYFMKGLKPPTVIRIRELKPNQIVVFDALHSQEFVVDSIRLRTLLSQGVWLLTAY